MIHSIIKHLYTVSLLLRPRGRKVYRIDSLYPPGYPVTFAVLRSTTKGTFCRINFTKYVTISCGHEVKCTMKQVYTRVPGAIYRFYL
jgi:hypothetical protein